LGPARWSALRRALSHLLRTGSPAQAKLAHTALVPQSQAAFSLPAQVGDYTDFYTSVHHATNIGRLFRPDNPLLPNYKWVPIAYHGRASSLIISGTGFRRPQGQLMPPGAQQPTLAPCKRLDYELELGVFIGPGNERGQAIGMDAAEAHVFGLCLLNDWSARDIQGWEYQPLGPFLSKNFATSRCPTWTARCTASRAPSTFNSMCACRPRPCDKPASRPHPLRSPTTDTPTGPWRKWSPTTPWVAAPCSPVTCWARARSQALKPAKPAP
jgi:fumarylacetoacetase